jgi:hypothetical protein
MTYSEKLKDPRWQEKRLEILERDDYTCYMCEDEANNVHHLRYYGEPWEVDNEDLISLCYECHTKWHANEQYKKLLINKLSKFHPSIYKDIIVLLETIEEMLPKTDLDDITHVMANNKEMLSESMLHIYLSTI